jgi:hypothetical protein
LIAALAVPSLQTSALPASGGHPATSLLRDRQVSMFTLVPQDHCKQGEHRSSCIQLDTEIEPSISANPENPLNAVTVFQSGRRDDGGDADNGYATTFDAGKTWTHGLMPGLTKGVGGEWERASDPVVAFGPHNVVYVNSLVFNIDADNGLRSGLAVNVSHDGGRTWGAPVFFQDDMIGGLNDKNWMSVDLGTGAGHHPGRVYVVWDRAAPVTVAYSDDEGVTWQTSPTDIGYIVYPGQGIGALPLVLNDGSLGVLFQTDASPTPILHPNPIEQPFDLVPGQVSMVFAVSPLAGSLPTGAPLVFTPPVGVALDEANSVRQQRACEGIPAATVDRISGIIYVVWTDGRLRTDNVNDVLLVRSEDNGLTWTSPTRVNGGPADDYLDHWCGAVDVGPAGDVRVSYRTRREAASAKPDGSSFSDRVGTEYVASYDHGDTFTAPVSATTVVSDMHFAAQSRGGAFLGDYSGVAAAGPYTYVVHIEPMRINAAEPKTFPPRYHHQRAWVAVMGPPEPAAPRPTPPPRVLGRHTTRRPLPSTGVAGGGAGALLLLTALVLHRVARRVRT